VFAGNHTVHRAPPAVVRPSGAPRLAESHVAPVATGVAGEGTVQPAPEAAVAAAPPEPAAARTPEAAGRASSPSIAREIAALDVARRLLGSGNPRGALGALD